jgi:Histidine kinase-like ATPase domain
MSTNNDELRVSLTIPNKPVYLRLVRLVAASIAADLGFDYEEIEDLRIVADEVVNLAMEYTLPESPISVDLYTGGPKLRVEVSGSAREYKDVPALDPLAFGIVHALVESHSVLAFDGRVEASFCSRVPKSLDG